MVASGKFQVHIQYKGEHFMHCCLYTYFVKVVFKESYEMNAKTYGGPPALSFSHRNHISDLRFERFDPARPILEPAECPGVSALVV